MSLPSIVEVAERSHVEINPRTLGKTEVYAKCPFCTGDANRKGKYKLSMNTDYNVFKCWICGEHGGVLEFESKLTGVPYDEVKAKYFGKKAKKYHPAEMLSPMQLKKIGWAEYKRQHQTEFKSKKDAVLQDWKRYEREEMIKHFAMLMVIAHLEKQEERQTQLLEYVQQSCSESQVKLLFSKVLAEYVKADEDRSEWAFEAIELARSAWKVSLQTFDFEMEDVMKYLVMLLYFRKMQTQNDINEDSLSKSHKSAPFRAAE